MASVNPIDEEQNQQPGAPVTTGGSGGASTNGGGKAPVAPQSPVAQNQGAQQTAGYTDVGTYLDANKGGSQQLGNQVAGNLTSNYNTVKGGIDQSAQSAQQSAQSGYVPENTQLIQQVAADPTAAANDPTKTAAYEAQLNDTYNGPTNWADLGTQQGNVNQANQYAGLLNTPGGLNVYTSQVEGQTGQGQSQGINQLDSLLLGGSPDAMSTVKAAADPYSGLNDYINSQNTAVGNAITAGQTGAQQTAQDALGAFTGANGTLTNLNNTVNKTAATDLATAQAQQAALNKDIAALYSQPLDSSATSINTYGGQTTPWVNTTNYNVGQLSPTDLQQLGITQDQWNALQQQMQLAGTSQYMTGHNFGAGSGTAQVDLGSFLNERDPASAINASTTATPQQYAEMSAIEKLLGGQTPQGNALNPANAVQAGTAPTNLSGFDYKNTLDTITQAQQAERADAQQEANAISSSADLAHAQSQHNHGFFGAVKNMITHPLTALATVANPLAIGANTVRLAQGRNVNPEDISGPGAKFVAPIAGGVIGGIYGGPVGASAGITAGGAIGGTLQDLGGNENKSYAHGGLVEKYLDDEKVK